MNTLMQIASKLVVALLLGLVVSVQAQAQAMASTAQSTTSTPAALQALITAMRSEDSKALEPHLASDIRAAGYTGDIARKAVLQFVSVVRNRVVDVVVQPHATIADRYDVQMHLLDAQKQVRTRAGHVLLNAQGQLQEVALFEARTSPASGSGPAAQLKQDIHATYTLLNNAVMGVQATVNGQTGWFVIDSGAPMLTINQSQAPQLSKVDAASGGATVSAKGIGGAISNVSFTKIDQFEWQGLTLSQTDALLMPLDHLSKGLGVPILGLIGQRELRDVETVIHAKLNRISLLKLDDNGQPNPLALAKALSDEPVLPAQLKPKHTISFVLSAHVPILTAKLGEESYRLGIDTGASRSTLPVRASAVHQELLSGLADTKITGAQEKQIAGQRATVQRMLINNLVFEQLEVALVDSPVPNRWDGLLGFNWLNRSITALNYKQKLIKLY